jgi:hypothetical protein
MPPLFYFKSTMALIILQMNTLLGTPSEGVGDYWFKKFQ